ncbi:hypothetical protein ACRYI5_07560 [Furfurilactobacillus sp. WILCCON 0119]
MNDGDKKRLVKFLNENYYVDVYCVWLRGSSLFDYGSPNDIDLLVVSDDFLGMGLTSRRRLLNKGFEGFKRPIDALTLTVNELKQMMSDKLFLRYLNRMERLI